MFFSCNHKNIALNLTKLLVKNLLYSLFILLVNLNCIASQENGKKKDQEETNRLLSLLTPIREINNLIVEYDNDFSLHKKITLEGQFLVYACFSPCGNYIASLSKYPDKYPDLINSDDTTIVKGQRNIYLWDANTGNHIKTIVRNRDISSIAYSPCGKFLAAGIRTSIFRMSKPHINIYDLNRFSLNTLGSSVTKTYYGKEVIRQIQYSPNGQFITFVEGGRSVKTWNISTNECVPAIKGCDSNVTTLSYSPNGKFLASTGYAERAVKIWDIGTGNCIQTLPVNIITSKPSSLAYSPCGKYIILNSNSDCFGSVYIWDASNGSLNVKSDAQAIEYSRCGNYYITNNSDFMHIYDRTNNKLVDRPCNLEVCKGISKISYSPCGRFILAVSNGYYPSTLGQQGITIWRNGLLRLCAKENNSSYCSIQ